MVWRGRSPPKRREDRGAGLHCGAGLHPAGLALPKPVTQPPAPPAARASSLRLILHRSSFISSRTPPRKRILKTQEIKERELPVPIAVGCRIHRGEEVLEAEEVEEGERAVRVTVRVAPPR